MKGEKPMRKMVTTTLRQDLWRGLQVRALNEGRNANDVLEELIAAYLKKPLRRKGGK
jgi:hypothetical protein